ncbi:phosphotransferase [Sulfurimonas sp. C5]|uniref:phosphotransferase n=1 Tax=Sulfurimonas sp. C5 TaxID=3036947 RepID=UPI0024572EC0|nr:phosphotransferase [Sulfurimonas sp. C5]MDH4944799.1 phosphotransferase [Sulfurimonas sp. C5]
MEKNYEKVHLVMGVNIHITLNELQELFPSYNFVNIEATKDGVIDTTYIVTNTQTSYILKHFDRDISSKIQTDKELLTLLKDAELNVPEYIDEKKGWYLFSILKGSSPKVIQLYHIQALARFMAKYHAQTTKINSSTDFIDNYPIKEILSYTKKYFYRHYKELENLQNYSLKTDGFIHGDIFKDNTIFDGEKIGVFDFIDGGSGEFAFDIAVALISFNPKNKSLFTNAFLRTYNQTAPKKLTLDELQAKEPSARQLYALLRIERYKNTQRANELLKIC